MDVGSFGLTDAPLEKLAERKDYDAETVCDIEVVVLDYALAVIEWDTMTNIKLVHVIYPIV